MEKHTLSAQIRDLAVKPKALRRDGMLPANIFGQGESRAISLSVKETSKLLGQISESTVFYVQLDGKEYPVMLGEVGCHPVSGEVLHLALREVDLHEKVTAAIPVETVGSFSVPGAIYTLVQGEIEAEGLPTDLPEKFVLDLSKLTAIGDEIRFSDLDYDHSKVTLKIDDEKLPVLVVDELKEETEAEEAGPASSESTEVTAGTDATATDKA